MLNSKNIFYIKGLRIIYNILLYLMLPVIFIHLWSRGRKQPEYFKNIKERFGFYDNPIEYDLQNNRQKYIWIHAVSVGETRASQTLIKALQQDYPDHKIVLTHMTPTGRATAQELFLNHQNQVTAKIVSVYAPYDYKSGLNRFLRHFQPEFGLILETEIWFNMIYECHKHRIPLFLVNARLSEKSFKRYEILHYLTEYHLRLFSGIAVQSDTDAERFKRLGVHDLLITGNLKFDIVPSEEKIAYGNLLKKQFGGDNRKIVLFSSTRAGEEELILNQLGSIVDDQSVLCVIVPRHPQRFSQVAHMIKQAGYKFIYKSKLLESECVSSDTQVVLGDTMGELISYYQACDLAIIGGSLLPYGSQNLIEACSVGKPIIIGEHTFNFAEASRLALKYQAGIQIHDVEQLASQINHLLNNPYLLEQMGNAGLHFSQSHQGATQKLMNWVHKQLDE